MAEERFSPRVVIPLSILSVSTIVTNTLVCLLVYKVKSMRNYTNGFVVSLAISDILTGVSMFIQYNAELHVWSRATLNVLYAVVLFVGAANLCAVTYDRYLAILYPFSYTETISKVFKILVPAIWVFFSSRRLYTPYLERRYATSEHQDLHMPRAYYLHSSSLYTNSLCKLQDISVGQAMCTARKRAQYLLT